MSISEIEFVKHIKDELDFIYSKSNLDFDNFFSDEILKRAIVRSLEIIGEAVKKLPNDFKNLYPYIKWKEIAGMWDVLIHDYFGIDYEIVWDVVKNKVPELKKNIDEIIESYYNN